MVNFGLIFYSNCVQQVKLYAKTKVPEKIKIKRCKKIVKKNLS